MNKVIIAVLILIVIGAIYGFIYGMESWSAEQSWWLLGVVGAVLAVWAIGIRINRNESKRRNESRRN